jgi:Tol biopolymer transport system component
MRTFHLWMVNFDGTGLQRVTSEGTFNAFPMFSPDGKKLVWASNRFNPDRHLSDIVLSEWKETTEGEVK